MERKRKALTLATKVKILYECEKNVSKSKSEIAKKYGLASSTLFTILKNSEKIKEAALQKNTPAKSMKLRNGEHVELEESLFTWFCYNRSKNVPITGPMLKTKAIELSVEMRIENFNCSDGWLNRFKTRKGISLQKLFGESASVNMQAVQDWFPILSEILARYDPKDVYNADEAALFYNLLPDRTLAVKGDSCKGGKRSKERLTFLCCANMDGSHKLKVLVIGKSRNHHCFRNAVPPCTYEANLKAWMTMPLFIQWLRAFDVQVGIEKRKIVLFIDNCPAHPSPNDVQLENIELIFLPPNCTSVSVLQPFNQGVIKLVKQKYKTILINDVIRRMLPNLNDKAMKWNILEAMKALVVCWNELPGKHIAACFKHAGFITKDNLSTKTIAEKIEEKEADGWTIIAKKWKLNFSFEDYVSADADVVPWKEIPDADDAVMMEEGNEISSTDDDQDAEDENERMSPPHSELMKSLNIIGQFYNTSNAPIEEMSLFRKVESYVIKSSISKLKQKTLDFYFCTNKDNN